MDKNKIIQAGDLAKFWIVINHEGFDQSANTFYVILHYGMLGGTMLIKKDAMVQAGDKWILQFDSTGMTGRVKAECHYEVPDEEVGGGVREEVDYQWLAYVTDSPCAPDVCDCQCSMNDGHVSYERDFGLYAVKYGAGETYEAAINEASVRTTPAGTYTVTVVQPGSYVWFVIDARLIIKKATMGGFEFPLEAPVSFDDGFVKYLIYQSSNTYDAGELEIKLT